MAAKIVGFDPRKISRAALSNNTTFLVACKKYAEAISPGNHAEIMAKVATKRQASKFFKRTGIVYETVCAAE